MASVNPLADINGLVAQLMALERSRGPLALYQNDRQALTLRSATLTDLRASLSALNTQAQALTQAGTLSPFLAKSVTSSSTTVAVATASASAAAGTHTLLVTQLAKQSTVVSDQLAQVGTDVSAAVGAGTQQIRVTVAGTSTDVDVAVAAGETNATVLSNAAAAINASGAAVTASVVADSSSTSRLVIASKSTGSANAVTLADVSGTLLGSTGTSSGVASSGTAGGFLYAAAALDATFTLDGLSITRGSNTVTDALTGVTLNLVGTGASSLSLTVGADQTAIKAKVQGFLDSYNTLVKFLKERTGTKVDITAGAGGVTQVDAVKRGILAGEPTYSNLLTSLRADAGGRITTAASGGPASLSEIGITAAADGTLSITDATKFADTLNAAAEKVAALFNSADGLATRMVARAAGFVNTGGVVDGSLSAVTARLQSVNLAIKRQEDLLKVKEAGLRQQYIALQRVLAGLLGQQAAVDTAAATGIFS